MKRTALLVLLAVGIGVGIGYFWPDSERVRAREPDREPEAAAVAPRSVAPAPDGRITGKVSTRDGQPVAGVSVRAVPIPRPGTVRAAHARTEGEVIEEAVRLHASMVAALTADDGTYELSAIAAGSHVVRAERDGLRLSVARGQNNFAVRAGERVDFVAVAVHEYDVDVRLPNGDRAERAVLLVAGDARRRQGWSPDKPRLTLEGGTYEIHAFVGKDAAQKSPTVRVVTGESPTMLVLQLAERPGIRGKVILPDGWQARNLTVRCGPAAEFEAANVIRFGQSTRMRPNRGPGFVFLDLAPGRYVVCATLDRMHAIAHAEVEVADALVERDLEIEDLGEKGARVVRVVAPDGKPLQDVRFYARYRNVRGGGVGPCAVADRGDGSFLIRPNDFGLGGEGTHTLSINAKGYGRIRRVLDLEDVSDFVVKLAPPAEVEVSIDGYPGSAHMGQLRLHIQPAGEEDEQRRGGSNVIDGRGIQTFPIVQSGDAVIIVGVEGEDRHGTGGSFWAVARQAVTLKPGLNRVRVPIPALYPLKIVSENPPAGPEASKKTRVRVSPVGSRRDIYIMHVTLDRGGRMVIPRLAAGRYTVSGYERAEKKTWTREVSLPGQGSVRIP
ncbi:MAG: carboxypeptidase-like regulatory domain-containing protein [Planctomycetota bacterium]|jgi:hypothetical protein